MNNYLNNLIIYEINIFINDNNDKKNNKKFNKKYIEFLSSIIYLLIKHWILSTDYYNRTKNKAIIDSLDIKNTITLLFYPYYLQNDEFSPIFKCFNSQSLINPKPNDSAPKSKELKELNKYLINDLLVYSTKISKYGLIYLLSIIKCLIPFFIKKSINKTNLSKAYLIDYLKNSEFCLFF